MIIYAHGKSRYFDKHGREITDGCTIRYEDGRTEKVYRTTDDQLGTDATMSSLRADVLFFTGTKVLQPRVLFQCEIWRKRSWVHS